MSSVWKNSPPEAPFATRSCELGGRLGLEDGRAGNGHQDDGDVRLADRADREPAEVAHLGHGHVVAKLHAELLRVELERLVLVVHPLVDGGELHLHRVVLLVCLIGRRPR